jgi:GPH family glycoside/pentoside/hexuronide:cation symporter
VNNGYIDILPLKNQTLFALGSFAFTLLERMILLYAVFYFLPPAELGLHNLIPDRTYFGIFTMTGAALVAGRIFDALADPVIAALSDNNRSKVGRRKVFLMASALPLAITAALIFFPPLPERESMINGFWLAGAMCIFYVFFTAYVNPYLALMSELGHTDALRINLSTIIALFGLLGMILVTVLFPLGITAAGRELRDSYRLSAALLSAFAAIILVVVTFSFNEAKHCRPVAHQSTGMIKSLIETLSVKPFRIFLLGEIFLQLAMNIVTLGLIYYAVVLFQRDQGFITVLAAITIGTALLSFPLINKIAKKVGKKKVITSGVLILSGTALAIFLLSFHTGSIVFYLSLFLIALCGLPLAILTILINPTIADLARAETIRSGQRKEAMYFGARAIPLKAAIALSGVLFSYLLSAFGKDICNPFGVQLSILVVSMAAMLAFIFFSLYPEQEVMQTLKFEE